MKTSRQPVKKAVRPLAALDAEGIDIEELTSFICNHLDRPVSQITDLVKQEFNITFGREQSYELVRRAAAQRRLRYDAPIDSTLSHKLVEKHDWIKKVRVVRTIVSSDVALHAARLLVELVATLKEPELHIGFAGGSLLAETVRAWAEFMRFRTDLKIRKLYVHAMVAASYDPRRSPYGFAQWLLDDSLPFKTVFVGLPTPAFLNPSDLEAIKQIKAVREVFAQGRKLHIVVTSAGAHWKDNHSGLNRQLAELSPKAVAALKESGCIGDILWQPFGTNGPVRNDDGLRAVTLLDLVDLQSMVRNDKRVMVVLAPCAADNCGGPKYEMLRSLLNWPHGFTDLVVDARAASLALPPGEDFRSLT